MKQSLALLTLLIGLYLQLAAQRVQPSYNILFFGNSFTEGSGGDEAKALNGIPGLVQQIAIAGGHGAPQVQKTTRGGSNLRWHYQKRLQTISNPRSLAPVADNFQWDFVVLQEFSTGPTDVKIDHKQSGLPNDFLNYSGKLFDEVAKHSPEVNCVLYMTWARHPEKEGFYPSPFKDPSDFQSQLRKYYHQAAEALNKSSQRATVAPAGDAWEALGFPAYLYADDLYHASNQGTLLNSLIIYRSIYKAKTSELHLSALGKSLEISESDLKRLQNAADSTHIETSELD
jgi:hypothetical protein